MEAKAGVEEEERMLDLAVETGGSSLKHDAEAVGASERGKGKGKGKNSEDLTANRGSGQLLPS